jgi:uncharacterized protein involved in type VI secretion and phage assembly
MSPTQRFFGKYRGVVTNNLDPMQLGRIQVSVPAVLGGGRSSWAMPCVPYAGPNVGFFAIPPVDANVWVEFEGGDPDYPIWAGCFWGTGQLPPGALTADTKVWQTGSNTLKLDDLPGAGGVTIELSGGGKIVINVSGVEITDNQGATIKLTGPQVSVNDGALEVT